MKPLTTFILLMLLATLVPAQVEYFIPPPPYNLPLPPGTRKVTERAAWGKADSLCDPHFQPWYDAITEYDEIGIVSSESTAHRERGSTDKSFYKTIVQMDPDNPQMSRLVPSNETGQKLELPFEEYPQLIRDTTGRVVHFKERCYRRCSDRVEYAFQYNEAGKLTKVYPTNPRFLGMQQWKLSYDNTGTLTGLKHFEDRELIDTYEYRYDSLGRMEGIRFNRKLFLPKRWFVTTYTYDAQDRITNAVTRIETRRQTVFWTIFYFYD